MLAPPLTLADAIRRKRLAQGLSQRELSQRAGLTANYVTKLETGQTAPSAAALSKICLALQMSTFELLYTWRLAGTPTQSDE